MYEIIDAHVHIYPDSLVNKATKSIRDFYGATTMPEMNGHISNLLSIGKSLGIKKYVVHSCATTKHQVKSINEFIFSQMQQHPEFIGFMTLYPDMNEEEVIDEINNCVNKGFKGIKLHPDFQKFYIDDDRMKYIYQYASRKLPILFHTGDPKLEYSAPNRLASIAKKYPDLTCVAAHFGGWSRWNELDCYEGLDNVFFDTSSTLPFITQDRARELIYKFGVEKYFFGTDFPMWDPAQELDRILNLGLSDSDVKKILSENFKRVFNMC